MMERTQFTFYESFYRAISRIKDSCDRAATYDAICAYALYGTMPDLDNLPDASAIAFELIKPNLDASRKKAAGGKKGSPQKDIEKIDERCGKDVAKSNGTSVEVPENKKENEKEREKEKENEKEVEDECLIPPPSDSVAAVLSDYLNRINATASPHSLDELRSYAEDLGEAVCKRAFDIALDNKKTTWPYIKAILQDKLQRGVKCLADWDALEEERKRTSAPKAGKGRREPVPSWMEKDDDTARRVKELHQKHTVKNDPELKARADQLRQSLAK